VVGLGKEKKPKNLSLNFDLEKDLENPKKQKEIEKQVQSQIDHLKKELRKGTDSACFERFGLLLQGYASLQKVVNKKEQGK